MEEKNGEKSNRKIKNRILIIVIVGLVLLLNFIFIFFNIERRSYLGTYTKEKLEDAFKQQFPLTEFENIIQKENGNIIAVIGYEKSEGRVRCAVFTQSLSYNLWSCAEKETLDKSGNTSVRIEVPSYGRVYLFWNFYDISKIVIIKNAEKKEIQIAEDEFVFQITDADIEEILFYTKEGTEFSEDMIF